MFEKVGVQFQVSNYPDKIKVKEICELTYSLYQQPKDWRKLLEQFGLSEIQDRMVADLSGGERQKLSVLLALIPDPEVVFLDELTTGLDVHARRSIWQHLKGLKESGLTILLTSHYMDEVEVLCDRICIMKNGQIIAMDSVERLVAGSPCEKLEDAYLWYICGEGTVYEVV